MKRPGPGALLALLLLATGCPAETSQPLVDLPERSPGAAPHVAPPLHLLAHVRLGAPARLLRNAAGLGRRIGAWQLDDQDLETVARELALATTDLAEHVDWTRPLHVLVLDPARHRSPLVWVLPVRSPRAALDGLARHCRSHRDGPRWIFTGGGRALLPCAFVARSLPRWLVVAPTPAALAVVWRFALATTLADRGPGHDLEVRAFVANVMAKTGLTRAKLSQLVQLGSTLIAFASGDPAAGPRIGKQLSRLLELATSASDAGLALDFGPEVVRLRLFATGRPDGALHRWIRDRRPAPLPRLDALPPRAPIALALPRPPRARTPAEPGLLRTTLLGRLPAWLQPSLAALLSRLLDRRVGSLRLAFEPVDTGGVCLVLLLEHPRPADLRKGLRDDLVRLLAATRAELKVFPTRALTVSERIAGSTHHLRIDLGGDWPPGARSGQLVAQWIAGGQALPVAMTHQGRQLIVALGADATRQAAEARRRLMSRRPQPKTRAPTLPAGRLGLVRLSLVELVRMVPILGVALAPAKGHPGALQLHWGVTPAARQVDATLDLPLDHLLASAPLWSWLLDRLEAQSEALTSLAPPSGPEPDDAL